jgi:hypothetical protein
MGFERGADLFCFCDDNLFEISLRGNYEDGVGTMYEDGNGM